MGNSGNQRASEVLEGVRDSRLSLGWRHRAIVLPPAGLWTACSGHEKRVRLQATRSAIL